VLVLHCIPVKLHVCWTDVIWLLRFRLLLLLLVLVLHVELLLLR
jgi:hypothetical protein